MTQFCPVMEQALALLQDGKPARLLLKGSRPKTSKSCRASTC
jgi:hypothetical protein